MNNNENKKQELEISNKEIKPEWVVPELTVISMDQTNSGLDSFTVIEGSFYGPDAS